MPFLRKIRLGLVHFDLSKELVNSMFGSLPHLEYIDFRQYHENEYMLIIHKVERSAKRWVRGETDSHEIVWEDEGLYVALG